VLTTCCPLVIFGHTPRGKTSCADAVPNAGITYDVLLISIFVSIFLLPVWRLFKEWLAMQKVYNRYITAASNIAHPRELSQAWVRVDSMSSLGKFNSRSNLSIEIDKASPDDDDDDDDNTANQIRDVEEGHEVAMKESKFNQNRFRLETSQSKNSRSEQQGVEMSICKSEQTDIYL
jgi:hypothetical protein